MTSSKAGLPRFGLPPDSYDRRYFFDLVRAFDQFRKEFANPGPVTATTLVLTNLPTSDQGLKPGTVYRVGNQLYISQANIAALAGNEISFAVGDVTVNIV